MVRVRITLTVMSVALLFALADHSRPVAAISLDNDVDIGISAGILIFCGDDCQINLVGAPRLIANTPEAASLKIHFALSGMDIQGNPVTFAGDARFVVNVHDALTLLPILSLSLGRPFFPGGGLAEQTVHLGEAEDFGLLLEMMEEHPSVILTITGEARLNSRVPGSPVTLTITFSEYGREITPDRLGDVDRFVAGDAEDIPPRSPQLARALRRIGGASGWNRLVEFDVAGRSGAEVDLGFTHTFAPPDTSRIENVLLRLHITGDGRLSDFILLDRAVRSVAIGQRCVPMIPLDRFSSRPALARPYDLTIPVSRLHDAPIPVSSYPVPGRPCPSRASAFDLLDLTDGRLNVVVVGDLQVDFSNLGITLFDR